MFRALRLLVVHYGLLETLREIHAMQRVLTVQVVVGSETGRPVGRLAVDKLAQTEQFGVARNVVEPIYDQQVVAAALRGQNVQRPSGVEGSVSA